MATIKAGKVTERTCENTGDTYFDVAVTVDGVHGTVSIEADGQALAGSNDVSDWASASLVSCGADLDEVRAVAAQAVQS